MGQLIVTEFITLDGVVDSPGGGDHPHAGWTFRQVEFDEAAYELKDREQKQAAAMLLGRVSYEEFAPVWPAMEEFAEYNAMPKYVVSSRLTDPQWHNTSVLRSLAEVARVKDSLDGPLLVHGSATLAQGLAAAGLVDRYHLLVFPLLLGAGRRLFDDSADTLRRLALVEHEAYANGVVKAVYDVVR
ncbi:deaminase [Kocuria flava]|uniref:Deaminase n=1 Tax=Kocuria flava TaxID=446860 RepID=A0A0U3HV54_9MICC|nr:dihydrofolate reductase family protein [Kocuria flava]ALU39184.1 deaminase [Kocuria flava]GEO93497.1 deaminase reductase [Kocuria flava]